MPQVGDNRHTIGGANLMGVLLILLWPLVMAFFYITQRIAVGKTHKEVINLIIDLYNEGQRMRED